MMHIAASPSCCCSACTPSAGRARRRTRRRRSARCRTDGPAAAAGILAGDVILSVDGVAVDADRRPRRGGAHVPARRHRVGGARRDGTEQTVVATLGTNTDASSPYDGSALLGVGSLRRRSEWQVDVDRLGGRSKRHRPVPGRVGVDQGHRQGAQPGQHRRATSPARTTTSRPARPRSSASPGSSGTIGDDRRARRDLYLLAVLNVFVGVFNMFPLLPLDGGHAAIAIYERIREGRTGRRYFADVGEADAVGDGRRSPCCCSCSCPACTSTSPDRSL